MVDWQCSTKGYLHFDFFSFDKSSGFVRANLENEVGLAKAQQSLGRRKMEESFLNSKEELWMTNKSWQKPTQVSPWESQDFKSLSVIHNVYFEGYVEHHCFEESISFMSLLRMCHFPNFLYYHYIIKDAEGKK